LSAHPSTRDTSIKLNTTDDLRLRICETPCENENPTTNYLNLTSVTRVEPNLSTSVTNNSWESFGTEQQPRYPSTPFTIGPPPNNGEFVEWEPIPPSFELTAPAGVHFDVPTLAQFWGYSWRERLFLRTLARNFTVQPRFSDGIEVPKWLQDGRYTTGLGPEGYITIRLPVLEALLARAIRDFPTACYRLFIPDGHTTPFVSFQGILDALEVVLASMEPGPDQANLAASADWEGYPGQELSPLSPETSLSMDLDSEMTPLSTPASSIYELEDEPPEIYQTEAREPEEFMVPPSALFTPHRWTRDAGDSNTHDPRSALSNRNRNEVRIPHSLAKSSLRLTCCLHQTEIIPQSPERPPLSVFSTQVHPIMGYPMSAMRSTQDVEGLMHEAPSAVSDIGMNRVVGHSSLNQETNQLTLDPRKPLPSRRTFAGHPSSDTVPDEVQVQRVPLNLAPLDGRDESLDDCVVGHSSLNQETNQLTLDPRKPLPSRRTFAGHPSSDTVPDKVQVQRVPLNLAPLDGRDESLDESPSPTLSYLTIPSDKSERGSEPSSPTGFTLLEPPPPRTRS